MSWLKPYSFIGIWYIGYWHPDFRGGFFNRDSNDMPKSSRESEPEGPNLQEVKYITILSNKKEITLNVRTILYIIMRRNNAEIHVSYGKIYTVRKTLTELKEKLGDGFILVHRSVLVSAMAIHDISDKIYLSNGESLDYVLRKKKEIVNQLEEIQKKFISSFAHENAPKTEEEYHNHYRSFDLMPFAFTDIEMVFDEKRHAVDWIFRYGNPALARLEKLPLDKLIGSSFGSLFSNMDSKWLRTYERVTIYGEIREIVDYSPEIDTNLKVICFPTFKGHCGCILFDISQIEFSENNSEIQKAFMFYLGKIPDKILGKEDENETK